MGCFLCAIHVEFRRRSFQFADLAIKELRSGGAVVQMLHHAHQMRGQSHQQRTLEERKSGEDPDAFTMEEMELAARPQ